MIKKIVVACIILLAIVYLILLLCLRKKKAKTKSNKKEKKPDLVKATTANLIPIVDIVEDDDGKNKYFVTKSHKYIDIYRIRTFDFDSMSPTDIDEMVRTWERFYQQCRFDIKVISVNLPTDTEIQQKFYEHKLDATHNEVYRPFLQEELNALQYIAKNRMDRFYYLMIFTDQTKDNQEFKDAKYVIEQRLVRPGICEKLSLTEKIVVLSKLGDKNSHMTSKDVPLAVSYDREQQEKAVDKNGYNPYLLTDISPAGGINFNVEKYIKTGSGYESCITVHKYPPRVGIYWMYDLTGTDNSIVTLDINAADQRKTMKNLNASIDENLKRTREDKEITSQDAAMAKVEELRTIASKMDREGQVMKNITLRIFLFARTFAEIDRITGTVCERLRTNNYDASVYINESKADWDSQFISYTQQQKTLYARPGQPILSIALSKGLPFHFSSLSDPMGGLLGFTSANSGCCLFSPFTKTSTRPSYNLTITGMMGAGKSTTLKKLMKMIAICGNYIRLLDPTGEYETLVGALGGRTISLDGSNGILNALEILKTSDEGENQSFNYHLSKLKTCYLMLDKTATADEIYEFLQKMGDFYSYFGIIDPTKPINDQQITGLPSNQYPTWTDFYNYLEWYMSHLGTSNDPIKQVQIIEETKLLQKIQRKIKNMISTYGSLVDGHTTVDQILDEPIISFSTKELVRMDQSIVDMQLFLALQLSYDNTFRIGSHMKELLEKKKINEWDATYSAIIIDESHRFLNASNPDLCDIVTQMMREARKYLAGIWLASQSITDFVPEGSSGDEIEKVRKLFAFSEIKMIMRQDTSSQNAIKNAFGSLLTDYDLQTIPALTVGDMILCIGSERKIQLSVEISDAEEEMFSGGR